MVFCCIAIVGIALIYYVALSLRQLFSGPRKDISASNLNVPPRSLTGNKSQPVFGHTRLFAKWGGDIALLFPPEWKEWRWLPESNFFNRQLGECFSIFIWGQWRVVIKGQHRVQMILETSNIQTDWAWSPPVTLLGKSCCLTEEGEEEFLKSLLTTPLSYNCIVRHAPEFAEIAERFVADLISGKFARSALDETVHGADNTLNNESFLDEQPFADEDQAGTRHLRKSKTHKIKWDVLRTYTLDLIDGPILALRKWTNPDQQDCAPYINDSGESGRTEDTIPSAASECDRDNPITTAIRSNESVQSNTCEEDEERKMMLLWIDRLKAALCTIKITMGTEWMYIWLLNEYGRAVNARAHLVKMLSRHVSKMAEPMQIRRQPGHLIRDPFAMPFPIITMAENALHRNENVVGGSGVIPYTRARSSSENNVDMKGDADDAQGSAFDRVPGLEEIECSLDDFEERRSGETANYGNVNLRTVAVRGVEDANPQSAESYWEDEKLEPLPSLPKSQSILDGEGRARANSMPNLDYQHRIENEGESPTKNREKYGTAQFSVLDHILRQEDIDGAGLTEAITTEICLLLWMILDAGNAWTAMALSLLSLETSACNRVQQELDELICLHGEDKLFTPKVLRQMTSLDALLYEAIRLCPAFLGGMKRTSQTVEFPDLGLQIPKNSHVIFCKPTEESFDMLKAMGKRPEDMGLVYPTCELHGFLPFKGLEVPLMVLQSKVFIAVLLKKCTPFLSKKRTFITRVKEALWKTPISKKGERSKDEDGHDSFSSVVGEASTHGILGGGGGGDGDGDAQGDSCGHAVDPESLDYLPGRKSQGETTQTAAMSLFNKIPFPEPRRVLNIRERESPLEIPGVTRFSPL